MTTHENNANKLDRRSFLMGSAAGLAGLTIAHTGEVSLAQDSESVAGPLGMDVSDEVDVLVVGGGSAGTIAAI